jgi:hypothetical protein
MNPNSKEFKKLQGSWYRKLASDGFQDIERPDGKLKKWESFAFSRKSRQNLVKDSTEFFRLAGMFYHEYRFLKKRDKIIWGAFAEGKVAPEILLVLATNGIKLKETVVYDTIQELTQKMLEFYGHK